MKKILAEIRERIEKHVSILIYVNLLFPPAIDEDKILILISILDQLEMSPHEKDTFIIAIMLCRLPLILMIL